MRFFGEPQKMASQKFLIATEKWAVKLNEHVKEMKMCGCLSVTKHSIPSKLVTNTDKIELRTNMYTYGNQGSQRNKI